MKKIAKVTAETGTEVTSAPDRALNKALFEKVMKQDKVKKLKPVGIPLRLT
jgi:hypothetical protein